MYFLYCSRCGGHRSTIDGMLELIKLNDSIRCIDFLLTIKINFGKVRGNYLVALEEGENENLQLNKPKKRFV